MTMREMAESYRKSADLIYLRMLALKDEVKQASDSSGRMELERRIHELKTLYRETCETALVLEKYCNRRRSADGGQQKAIPER